MDQGLGFMPAQNCFASVFRDGTYLDVSTSLDKTTAGIAALSPADAQAWRDLVQRFGIDAPHIFALLGSPMPSFAAAKVVWNAWRQQGTAWLFETLRLFLASPRDFPRRAVHAPQSQDNDGRVGTAPRFPARRRRRRPVSLSRMHGQPVLWHGDRQRRRRYDRERDDRRAEKAERGADPRRSRYVDRRQFRARCRRDAGGRAPSGSDARCDRQRAPEARIRNAGRFRSCPQNVRTQCVGYSGLVRAP